MINADKPVAAAVDLVLKYALRRRCPKRLLCEPYEVQGFFFGQNGSIYLGTKKDSSMEISQRRVWLYPVATKAWSTHWLFHKTQSCEPHVLQGPPLLKMNLSHSPNSSLEIVSLNLLYALLSFCCAIVCRLPMHMPIQWGKNTTAILAQTQKLLQSSNRACVYFSLGKTRTPHPPYPTPILHAESLPHALGYFDVLYT